MILNLLTSIYGAYLRLTTPRDWEIVRRELEYTIDPHMKYEIDDSFWYNESRTWFGELSEFHVDVTRTDEFRYTIVPQNVRKLHLRTSYYYNGRRYKMISENIDAHWPPESDDGSVGFVAPITVAFLHDADNKVKRDVTEKMKRYAGPRQNFHGQRVALRDVLYYDDDALRELYPFITLRNLMGKSITLSTLDGFTTDLKF